MNQEALVIFRYNKAQQFSFWGFYSHTDTLDTL
jgi:hypothetical protein